MSLKLAELIQQVETLSIEDQSRLVAHFVQKLTNAESTAISTVQPPTPTPKAGKSI